MNADQTPAIAADVARNLRKNGGVIVSRVAAELIEAAYREGVERAARIAENCSMPYWSSDLADRLEKMQGRISGAIREAISDAE